MLESYKMFTGNYVEKSNGKHKGLITHKIRHHEACWCINEPLLPLNYTCVGGRDRTEQGRSPPIHLSLYQATCTTPNNYTCKHITQNEHMEIFQQKMKLEEIIGLEYYFLF